MSKRLKTILPAFAVILAVVICIVWVTVQKSTMHHGKFAEIRISGTLAEKLELDKNTKIHYIDLSINCEDFEKQFTPYETDKDITNYFVHSKTYNNYVAFSLDKLTFLKVDNDLISEGLNDEKQINLIIVH